MMQQLNKNYLNVKLYMWLAALLFSLFFLFFPQIDIQTSALFYDGHSFYLKGSLFERFFYHSVKIMLITFTLASFSIYFYNKIKKRNILGLNNKVMLYIILVLSVAPGLIVNATLKNHWGRARPANIKEFGGHKTFTPAFVLSNQKGHSFSSGHTSAAFAFVGFALLSQKRRKFWMTLAISYGILVSFARLIAGGHFLSDIFTSFFIVWIVTHILYKIIFKKDSTV
ncbi:Bll0523 protein [hydrothermal vent metagenome]|uniref:Bll0523 protein n=1 Tax=hydrothermal vent metagenome TaxID=652676 RepID=A0A1W1CNH4_9ZZZZ